MVIIHVMSLLFTFSIISKINLFKLTFNDFTGGGHWCIPRVLASDKYDGVLYHHRCMVDPLLAEKRN